MRRAFDKSGEIRDVDLLAALVRVWQDRASVTLDFTRPGVSSGFDVVDGEIVATFSADPRFDTAAILVRAGKLDAAALERLSVPEGSDRSLAAMQAGLLTRREWKWGEKIRAIEVLSDLLTWGEGRYLVEPDTRSVSSELKLPISRLLLELFLRSRDRALVDHQLGNPDAPLRRSERFDAEFATFGLTADAESVVRLIDGTTSAREISSRAPADTFAVEKLLAALVTLQLLRPGEAAESPELRAETPSLEPLREPAPEEGLEGGPEPAPGEADSLEAEIERSALAPQSSPLSVPDLPDAPLSPDDAGNATGAEQDLDTRDLDSADRKDLPIEKSPASWDTLSPETPDPILERPEEPSAARRGGRHGIVLAGIFVALAAAVAVVLFMRSRGGAPAPPQRVALAASPSPVPQAPSPTAVAVPTPIPTTARAPTPPKHARRATALPTRPPAAARKPTPAARAPAAQAPASRVAAGERRPWLERAEASRRRLSAEPSTRYAVQLLLACEVSTLEDAFRHDQPTGSIWLLTTDHQGRTCFRVLWGRFATAEEARKAKGGVPLHFVTPGNKPAVVAVR
jgi:hypothetical protein